MVVALIVAGVVGPWGIEFDSVRCCLGQHIHELDRASAQVSPSAVGSSARCTATKRRTRSVSVMGLVVTGLIVLILALMWTVSLPYPSRTADGLQTTIAGTCRDQYDDSVD